MIAGLQKMTLLDYPGRVACTVFLQGCNYRCPFCHNSDLLPNAGTPLMEPAELLAFLEKRKGLLDGVCISGGEPTLHPGLEELLRRLKALGYAVKLDTNGSRPDVLKRLAAQGLVDHVAMDIKNSPALYAQTCGLPRLTLAHTEECIRFLLAGTVSYELRTTVVTPLHTEASVLEMGQWLAGLCPNTKPRVLYLQPFTDRDTVLFDGLGTPDEAQLAQFARILAPYVEQVSIRGK